MIPACHVVDEVEVALRRHRVVGRMPYWWHWASAIEKRIENPHVPYQKGSKPPVIALALGLPHGR